MRFGLGSSVALALLVVGPCSLALAQPADPTEEAFWQAVAGSGRMEEYEAYVDAYPHGRHAAQARLLLRGSASQPAAPLASSTVPAGTNRSGASVRPVASSFRATDVVTLDVDAAALAIGSNLRLIVVPASSPDQVGNPDALVAYGTPIHAGRLHVSIPSGPSGNDEVRLYYVPQFQESYVVAARAPVTVGPGVPGAVFGRDLAREAAQVGPVSFEANHRDRPILVQAAFLRIRPHTEWNAQWFAGGVSEGAVRRIVVLSLGQPNVAPDYYGSTGEVICALSADNRAVLDRVAALHVGDPVVVSGVPTSWDSAGPGDPVLLDGCALR